jgi:carboxypeptidase C (cathepsin A)
MGSYVLLPVVLAALAYKSAAYTAAAQNDRIVSLPGATSALLSSQFSGYLNVSSTRGIHYMYFESERDPEKDPVIFWTNGGPGTFRLVASCSPQLVTYAPLSLHVGCSGLLGLYTEFGPWRAAANLTLIRNPFSWTKYASIVFLEQPVGVGFSYSTTAMPATGKMLAPGSLFRF